MLIIQHDPFNMAVFFWYLVKMTYPVHATVHVYTEKKRSKLLHKLKSKNDHYVLCRRKLFLVM